MADCECDCSSRTSASKLSANGDSALVAKLPLQQKSPPEQTQRMVQVGLHMCHFSQIQEECRSAGFIMQFIKQLQTLFVCCLRGYAITAMHGNCSETVE
jgi:hypothetical protein